MSYSRFYKADLQMQTPADRHHWRGTALAVGAQANERAAAAEAYVSRCYETGLEVIAITDHNICPHDCESLIPEIEAAAQDLSVQFGYRLTIFPGFEVAVPFGKGVHILCLFEPGTSVSILDEKLAALGLPKAQRFTSGRAAALPSADLTRDRIIKTIQEDPNIPGLIILAHATGNSGVFDPKTIEQWWSADVVKDERLLCVELPHPRDHYLTLPDQPLTKSILQNKDSRYERAYPLASICSSDCKNLTQEVPDVNYIGFRHTWIKMANPSIEGLRQAFLDHESRIRFGDRRPEDLQSHSRIESFSISKVRFLRNLEINFSPNLNVIIGGSGSGKSTIVNYLRMCLGQADNIHGDDVGRNYTKSTLTIADDSRFALDFKVESERIHLTGQGVNSLSEAAAGSELGELTKALPVRFYGQREIYNIAEDREATRRLLDDLVQGDLANLRRTAGELTDQVQGLQISIDKGPRLRHDRDELLAEVRSTEAKINRLRETAQPLALLSEATSRVGRLKALKQQRLLSAAGIKEALSPLKESAEADRPGRVPEYLVWLWDESRAALVTLANTIDAAHKAYESQIATLLDESAGARNLIDAEQAAIEQTEAIREQLEEQGVNPNELAGYQEAVEAKRADIDRLDAEIGSIAGDVEYRATLIAKDSRQNNLGFRV